MKKIFLSKSTIWKSRDEVNRFIKVIREYLVDCIILPYEDASLEIKFGNNWETDIYSSISDCDLFIAIIDKNNSPFSLYEIGYAQGAGKKIIIILTEGGKVPPMLRKHLCYKMENDKFDLIIKSIENELKYVDKKKELSFREILKESFVNTNLINNYSNIEFENKIRNLFFKKGFECEYNSDKIDIGYDLIIKNFKENKNALIECKKYDLNKKVSIESVIQLLADLELLQIDIGFIITSSTFTNSAIEYAKKIKNKQIMLWDINKLEEEAFHNIV